MSNALASNRTARRTERHIDEDDSSGVEPTIEMYFQKFEADQNRWLEQVAADHAAAERRRLSRQEGL